VDGDGEGVTAQAQGGTHLWEIFSGKAGITTAWTAQGGTAEPPFDLYDKDGIPRADRDAANPAVQQMLLQKRLRGERPPMCGSASHGRPSATVTA
jgi:hypothetical protein